MDAIYPLSGHPVSGLESCTVGADPMAKALLCKIQDLTLQDSRPDTG
jgi:hypothetical protein